MGSIDLIISSAMDGFIYLAASMSVFITVTTYILHKRQQKYFYDRIESNFKEMAIELKLKKELENEVIINDRLASIGTVAAGMVHEIKSPLITINSYTKLLPEHYKDEEFRNKFITIIGTEVARINSILKQLLDYSKPEKPIIKIIDIHVLLSNLIDLMKPQFKRSKIIVEKKFDALKYQMNGDSEQILLAFMNLLLNAIQSMENGGKLKIVTENIGAPNFNRLIIKVIDTGCGINIDAINKIYDPFFTQNTKGIGLGLSVTYRIIKNHEGSISVKNNIDPGTTFNIQFNLRQESTKKEFSNNLIAESSGKSE